MPIYRVIQELLGNGKWKFQYAFDIHKRGVVHRDIKPSNIIADEKLTPVLIGFDIASASDQETISLLKNGKCGYLGTAGYSAPEQLTAKEAAGPPVDLFALGGAL